MAYLYQEINKVPGLSGSSYDRQKQLYERLGSPKGAYRGTYDQNIWLLNQVNSGNYGSQPSQQRSQPQQQQQQQQQQGPSAEEILRRQAEERNKKYQDQAKIWNQFMDSPTFWDAVLARSMSEQYLNPHYKTVLDEFVNPLQTRISSSQSNEKRLLEELIRQRDVGEQEKKDELMTEIEKAQGGFAGAGVYGGGGARRAIARSKISGERTLQDFLQGNVAKQGDITAQEQQRRDELNESVAQKQRDVERERTGAVEEDVAKQRTTKYKGQAAKARETILGQFGELQPELAAQIPDWLRY
jgi:hypothetical protein